MRLTELTRTPMPDLAKIWADIDSDGLPGDIVRRVLPHSVHDVYLGKRRPADRRFVEFRLSGASGTLPSRSPSPKGIEVRVVVRSPSSSVVHLVETNAALKHQFEGLSADLVELLDSHPEDGATSRIVERILAWQDFFTKRSESFGADAAAGLFGELSVLSRQILPALGPLAATAAWTGPDPAIQDFQFALGAIEVKTYRGTGSGELSISSERQLDKQDGAFLGVAYLRLDVRKGGSGQLLAELVSEIRLELADLPSARVRLDDKLIQAGWIDSEHELDDQRFTVLETSFFEVTEKFPRLVPAMLPQGTGHVRYQIDRSALEPFKMTHDDLLKLLGTGS